jgi:hypothetical protein
MDNKINLTELFSERELRFIESCLAFFANGGSEYAPGGDTAKVILTLCNLVKITVDDINEALKYE